MWKALKNMKKIYNIFCFALLLFLIGIALFGCATKKEIQYVPIESVRIEYKDKLVRDSIYHLDSVYVRDTGDTVWVERLRYMYVDRIRQDSIHIHDSIPVPYPVEIVKFTNKLTWFQQTSAYVGYSVIALIIIYFGFKFIKLRFFS